MCPCVFIGFLTSPSFPSNVLPSMSLLWILAPAETHLLTKPCSEHIIIQYFCQPSIVLSHFHCLLLLFAVNTSTCNVIYISLVYTHLLKLVRSSSWSACGLGCLWPEVYHTDLSCLRVYHGLEFWTAKIKITCWCSSSATLWKNSFPYIDGKFASTEESQIHTFFLGTSCLCFSLRYFDFIAYLRCNSVGADLS